MQVVGRIDVDKYKALSSGILTDEVVLTDRQLAHIVEKREDVYEKYQDKLSDIVKNPDYIFADPKHHDTALVIKKYSNAALVVLRLSTETTDKKNSILTMWEIKESRLQRYILTHKTIYKKD